VALLGAFTILGTLAAIVLGWLGLRAIKESPDKLAGRNYALAGIVLGAVLTLFTLYAVTFGELFGLATCSTGPLGRSAGLRRCRRDQTADGALRHHAAVAEVGVARNTTNEGGQLDPGHVSDELLLVNAEEDAHLLVIPLQVGLGRGLAECRRLVFEDYFRTRTGRLFGKKRATLRRDIRSKSSTKDVKDLPGTLEGVRNGDRQEHGQAAAPLHRARPEGARGSGWDGLRADRQCSQSRFAHLEPEISKAIATFRRTDRVAP